jgi:LuxR family transcriptional regulator, regulator of acetate metabolism
MLRESCTTSQAHVHLGSAARKLREMTHADVGFRGVYTANERSFVLGELHGAQTDALSGLSIRRGSGVGGKAMTHVRPVAVDDYTRDDGISHQYDRVVSAEGLRALFAVPVRNQGGVVGVLYGGFRTAIPIGEKVLGPAVRVAREAEFRISVDEAVGRRLAEIETVQSNSTQADQHSVAREQLRAIQAELLEIAHGSVDESTREQLCALSRRLTGSADPTGSPRGTARKNLLSAREVEVLVQVAVGCSNREVGLRLSILPTTVKSYLQSAMRKLDASNRVEAVCTARRLGIIP